MEELTGLPRNLMRDLEGRPSAVTLRGGSVIIDCKIDLPKGYVAADVGKALGSEAASQRMVSAASAVPGVLAAAHGPIGCAATVTAEAVAGVAAPPPSADTARIAAENERLRAKNTQLRAAIAVVRPTTPVPITPRGPGLVPIAATTDELVKLLGEGSRLLLERDQLQAENCSLAAGGAAGIADEAAPGGGLAGETQDEEIVAIDRLMPLLSESDALWAEREALQAERTDLVSFCESTTHMSKAERDALQADLAGLDTHDEALRVNSDLEMRIRGALAEVGEENRALATEIAGLREDHTRLRNIASADVGRQAADAGRQASELRRAGKTDEADKLDAKAEKLEAEAARLQASPPELDSDEIENLFMRQQAMATVLGRIHSVASPKSSTAPELQAELAPEAVSGADESQSYQEQDMRKALHSLSKGFGK